MPSIAELRALAAALNASAAALDDDVPPGLEVADATRQAAADERALRDRDVQELCEQDVAQ